MPFVNIRLVKEVIADDPDRKKAEMTDKIAAVIAAATGVSEDQVWIVFEEVDAKDWFLGKNSVKKLGFNRP
jgi:4-oxalocrotonate tautomerase